MACVARDLEARTTRSIIIDLAKAGGAAIASAWKSQRLCVTRQTVMPDDPATQKAAWIAFIFLAR